MEAGSVRTWSAFLSIFSIFRGKDLSGFQQDVLPRQVRLENLTGLPQLLRGYFPDLEAQLYIVLCGIMQLAFYARPPVIKVVA